MKKHFWCQQTGRCFLHSAPLWQSRLLPLWWRPRHGTTPRVTMTTIIDLILVPFITINTEKEYVTLKNVKRKGEQKSSVPFSARCLLSIHFSCLIFWIFVFNSLIFKVTILKEIQNRNSKNNFWILRKKDNSWLNSELISEFYWKQSGHFEKFKLWTGAVLPHSSSSEFFSHVTSTLKE